MTARKRRRRATDPIEHANETLDENFVAAYLTPGAPGLTPWTTEWTQPRTGRVYSLDLVRSTAAGDAVLDACFALVEETSHGDYAASTRGWRPRDKKREMRDPNLRYIIVRETAQNTDSAEDKNGESGGGTIRGFASLMPTYEEGSPVVYCYEVHLKPELQGTGLGARLLGFLSIVAYNIPGIEKVMLTCFVSNKRAVQFYRKMGFATDAISPEPRRLRGQTHEPDYMILSKAVQQKTGLEAKPAGQSAESHTGKPVGKSSDMKPGPKKQQKTEESKS